MFKDYKPELLRSIMRFKALSRKYFARMTGIWRMAVELPEVGIGDIRHGVKTVSDIGNAGIPLIG